MKKISLFCFAGILVSSLLNTRSLHAQSRLDNGALMGEQTNRPFYIKSSPDGVEGPYIEMVNNSRADDYAGAVGYIAGYNPNPVGISHVFFTRTAASNGGWIRRMQVLQSGQVLIGDKAAIGVHADYKLSVYGKLTAKSLYILADNSTNWADYVFADNYNLMSLPDLETYIGRNRHLPDMPTTSDVDTNGINVAAMNTLLLKKVEELTLYLIEMNKQIQQLKSNQANFCK